MSGSYDEFLNKLFEILKERDDNNKKTDEKISKLKDQYPKEFQRLGNYGVAVLGSQSDFDQEEAEEIIENRLSREPSDRITPLMFSQNEQLEDGMYKDAIKASSISQNQTDDSVLPNGTIYRQDPKTLMKVKNDMINQAHFSQPPEGSIKQDEMPLFEEPVDNKNESSEGLTKVKRNDPWGDAGKAVAPGQIKF